MAILLGTPVNDILIGTIAADSISGLAGKDTVFGLDGDDTLDGGSDADVINGNQGNDSISGGDGSDLLRGGKGNDQILGYVGNDTIFGDIGDDLLFGNSDDDVINGNIGNDTIVGGEGNDIVRGGQGNDLVSGDLGNDLLYGDRGIDTLTGGDGNDIFFLRKGIGGATLAEADIINDFVNGVDKFGLIEGLNFANLIISQGTGNNADNTIIQDAANGQFLAVVKNVNVAAAIDATDFITPGTLEFSSAKYQVNEDGTPVQAITINRTNSSDTAVSVSVIPSDGSATAPADYDNTPIAVDFAPGETSKTITIPIVNDGAIEPKETINLTLANPTNGTQIGFQSSAVVEILDDDKSIPKLTFLNPTPAPNDLFGYSIAALGNNLLIGAPGDNNNSGTVYLFDGTTGQLLQTFSNPTPDVGDGFGTSVATLGNNVLVGSPSDTTSGFNAGIAYLFDGNTGALLQTFFNPTKDAVGGFSGDRFGVSLAAIGNNVLIGATGENKDAGAAYLFNGSTGQLLLTLQGPPTPDYDFFGFSVAALGNNLIVGSIDDDTAGAFAAGAAYLFDGTNGTLLKSFLDPPPVAHYDFFGASVAAVGDKILVGVPGKGQPSFQGPGAAYLFDSITGTLVQTFTNPNPDPGDSFGSDVTAVGNNVLISANRDSTVASSAGSAYLFNGTTGALLQSFIDPIAKPNDGFGSSLAALGNNIAIAAPAVGGDTGGAVYLF